MKNGLALVILMVTNISLFAETAVSSSDFLSILLTPPKEATNLVGTSPDIPKKHIIRADFPILSVTYKDAVEYHPASKKFPEVKETDLSIEERNHMQRYAQAVAQHQEIQWHLEFVSEKVGYGVFADTDLTPGEYIGEYVGIIVDEETLSAIPAYNKAYAWTINPPVLSGITQKFTVDATVNANFTRFINHSYNPNVAAFTIYCADGWHMIYVALKPIQKGQQLLVDYGRGYWYNKEPEELA